MNTNTHGRPSWTVSELLGLVPDESALRTAFFSIQPTCVMRAASFEWSHEIRVALPASYAHNDHVYPVLWITDNHLEAALAALGSSFGPRAELILVSVGADRVPLRESSRQRIYDFYPLDDALPDGSAGAYLGCVHPELRSYRGGGAARFLDFLIDDVRPFLASKYRMDPEDHGLAGFSAGGAFVGYALFSRPDAFSRYICGSPAMYAGKSKVFDLEERYAAAHNDLHASVFFGAGEAEATERVVAAFGCLSSMARMAETLTYRSYPSLRLTVKIFPAESHETVLHSILHWGVRSVWGDSVFPVPADA